MNKTTARESGRSGPAVDEAVVFDEAIQDEPKQPFFKGGDTVASTKVSTKPVTVTKAEKKPFFLSDQNSKGRFNQCLTLGLVSIGIFVALFLLDSSNPAWALAAFVLSAMYGGGLGEEADRMEELAGTWKNDPPFRHVKIGISLVVFCAAFALTCILEGVLRYALSVSYTHLTLPTTPYV